MKRLVELLRLVEQRTILTEVTRLYHGISRVCSMNRETQMEKCKIATTPTIYAFWRAIALLES